MGSPYVSGQPYGFLVRQGAAEAVVDGFSSGKLSIVQGGVINIDATSSILMPVTVMSTTSGTLPNTGGLVTIGTTVQSKYTLPAPKYAGINLQIACTVHGATTVTQTIQTATTAVIFKCGNTTGFLQNIIFDGNTQSIELTSDTTSSWTVIGGVSGGVVVSS